MLIQVVSLMDHPFRVYATYKIVDDDSKIQLNREDVSSESAEFGWENDSSSEVNSTWNEPESSAYTCERTAFRAKLFGYKNCISS